MRVCNPRVAAYLVAIVVAGAFSYDLMRVPVQVSDSLIPILRAQQSPSVAASFADTFGGAAYLRPLRIAQIKALFDLAHGHYWLVYRGFHALLLIAAILLFVRALDVRTWADVAAAVFALTVLTGLHTFRGTVREAFPINHFLEIVVFCLLAVNLARSRGSLWVDAAAVTTFVVASLTLESGLLVWVVVVAAWAVGMPGISRRGALAVTALLGVYFTVRFFVLHTGTPGLDERSSGFLLATLDPDELELRFGGQPIWFYAYNVAASTMSVLFSEPQSGVFVSVRAWLQGDVPPRLYVATVSSAICTVGIIWVGATRVSLRRWRAPSSSDQLVFLFCAVLPANAVLSYAYTKDEILSVAGVFYACAAFAAARHMLAYVDRRPRLISRVLCGAILFAVATVWAFRSAGVHHLIRVQAFQQRSDWAFRMDTIRDAGLPDDPQATALIGQLRRDALEMRLPNRYTLPRWADRWWGE